MKTEAVSFLTLAWPVESSGVDVPLFPTLASLVGAGLIVVFALQSLRAPGRKAAAPRQSTTVPLVAPPLQAPPPVVPQYKRAPVSIHFAQIRGEFPDVWGIGEPLEIALRLDEKALQDQRQLPGLTVTAAGDALNPVFSRGAAAVRHVFRSLGEKPIVAEVRLKGETLPRRTQRTVKVVEYRAEIAEVFANFREEASRAITPIRDDATPWEIYDILISANPKLPAQTLREIVASFEEAKYSNHPVTRATYERMVTALLQLEHVEL